MAKCSKKPRVIHADTNIYDFINYVMRNFAKFLLLQNVHAFFVNSVDFIDLQTDKAAGLLITKM